MLVSDPPEPDDELHHPDKFEGSYGRGNIFTARGISNLGFMVLLTGGLVMLFSGWPIYSHYTRPYIAHDNSGGLEDTDAVGFNSNANSSSGSSSAFPGAMQAKGKMPLPQPIDPKTPDSAKTKKSFRDGQDWELVFSDEFDTDNRSFYPGDDPYWTAADLHYWGTNDLEWYDPQMPTTRDGYLRLSIKETDPINNHNMSFMSGMIQSWNKFCFTGGLIEVSVQLPGTSNKPGLWPAVWAMGNLGRAGYGASLDGMWPYTYDHCDVGTLPNQTYPGTTTPLAAVTNGDPSTNNVLSYLPGQRLSACTCPGEPHPGPTLSNGSYVGRAAPEIDIFEALNNAGFGQVSQSAQWAPFNAEYKWLNTSDNLHITDQSVTKLNDYIGGSTQQTSSGLSTTNQDCYELSKGCFSTYGFEYKPGYKEDEAYISWMVNDTMVWGLEAAGLEADPQTEIHARPVPFEPMYVIMNLGLSKNFVWNLDLTTLTFPATMLVDWVRVYQPAGSADISCDPKRAPTKDYIDAHMEAYTNPNLTIWSTNGEPGAAYMQPQPKNSLKEGC
ncbi:glycoside hydrolase family 16 protein [Peniophora sp. CONT]|nr:glycoside hydrolase family 16 protein [Peniophora sp. CONT]